MRYFASLKSPCVRLAAVLLATLAVFAGTRVAPAADVEQQAYKFLKTYCHQCHGVNDEVGNGFNVLDRENLVAASGSLKLPYITAGEPEKSLIWKKAVDEKTMPDDYAVEDQHPVPTDAERAILTTWIKAGAKFPVDETRKFVSDGETLEAIYTYLRKQPRNDRPYIRFFTLTSLYNNPEITSEQLKIVRAAVSKVLNGFSWEREIVTPELTGPGETIMAFDMRDYGWTAESQWRILTAAEPRALPPRPAYPYGVLHGSDAALYELETEIREITGDRLSYIRADWFVTNATRPPYYDALLGLPETLGELERNKLKIDYSDNYKTNQILRAGMVKSGVSRHHRMVERHTTPFGAYWRSFDFGTSTARSNLLLHPLGPRFPGNKFDDVAFEEAGGEVIFNLPNGLQGYMLADFNGSILRGPAPISIVRDLRESAGTPEVVNGLSCIACHQYGMKRFKDEVRQHSAVEGDALEKVRLLYREQKELDAKLAADEKLFMDAAEKATAVYLKTGADANKSIRDFPEPIFTTATLYLKDLSGAAVAAELGLKDIQQLKERIGAEGVRELGLGPLLETGGVKRELWQRPGLSLYHHVGLKLKLTINKK